MLTTGIADNFFADLVNKVHELDADTLKVALYDSNATHGPSLSAYTATDEVSGSGYTAGGKALTPTIATADGRTTVTFADVSWTSSSFSARGAVIYNASASNAVIAVLDFGQIYTVSSGTLTIDWPDPLIVLN